MLKTETVNVAWTHGHDSLHLHFEDHDLAPCCGFFLNINGLDFGIEFDKVARICLPANVVLFDGEIDEGELINRPIGLFKTKQFDNEIKRGTQFSKPEIVFYGGERYSGRQLNYIVENPFMQHVERLRGSARTEPLRDAISKGKQFSLCPVTKHIIERWKKSGLAPEIKE